MGITDSESWRIAFRRKPMSLIMHDARTSKLSKTLSVVSLTMLGIGFVIGSGIFVLTGQAAAKYAGPALSLSFVFAVLLGLFSHSFTYSAHTVHCLLPHGVELCRACGSDSGYWQRVCPLLHGTYIHTYTHTHTKTTATPTRM